MVPAREEDVKPIRDMVVTENSRPLAAQHISYGFCTIAVAYYVDVTLLGTV
jgi:hypothetical protein